MTAQSRSEIVGLLGPNGAGKTTTLRILVGLLAPTGGRAIVGGHDVLVDPIGARRKIGWLPEGAPCDDEATVHARRGGESNSELRVE